MEIPAALGRDARLLEELAKGWTAPLALTPVTDDREAADEWMRDPAAAGIGGVVAKGADQPYEGGRDGWIAVRNR